MSLLNPETQHLFSSWSKEIHVSKPVIGNDNGGNVSAGLRLRHREGGSMVIKRAHVIEILPDRNALFAAQADLLFATEELIEARRDIYAATRESAIQKITAAVERIDKAVSRIEAVWDKPVATLTYNGERLHGCGARAFIRTNAELRVVDYERYNLHEVYAAAAKHRDDCALCGVTAHEDEGVILTVNSQGWVPKTQLIAWLDYYYEGEADTSTLRYDELLQAVMETCNE